MNTFIRLISEVFKSNLSLEDSPYGENDTPFLFLLYLSELVRCVQMNDLVVDCSALDGTHHDGVEEKGFVHR